MDNQRYERDGRRPGRIGRLPGEAVRSEGENRAAIDEERSFGPPRGPYEARRGYGEASRAEGDYRNYEAEPRYRDGYSVGSPAYDEFTGYSDREPLERGPYSTVYGRQGGPYARPGRGPDDRGFWDRMSDEAASWFGDTYARDRREADHRGRGPKGYRRSAERISEDAHDRLTEDRHLDASDMEISVKDGEVTLSGTVPSRHDKHHAEHVVERISGVDHVQNNLRVAGVTGPSDSVLDKQASGRT